MSYLLIIGGLILLFAGGEALVRGSVGVARRLGVSELVIGLTLVGFGTSVPELVTSLRAVGQDAAGLSVGNVAGSNIANVLLVLGAAAAIRPIVTHPAALVRDFSCMVLATAVFLFVVYYDIFTQLSGAVMLTFLIAYIAGSFLLDRRESAASAMHAEEGEIIETDDTLPFAMFLSLVGLAGVIIGARLLVTGGIDVARGLGVSETVIGLSIVAIGTSLPELATTGMSALRGKSDVALGTVLGSNIFNALGIIGVTAIVHPFTLTTIRGTGTGGQAGAFDYGDALRNGGTALEGGAGLTWTDVSALILSVFFIILFAFTGRRLARTEGFIMLAAYVLYLSLVFKLIPTPF
ncbi:MAG: calcium/sodium antiporter [Pseudomonadota bacterium]